MSNIIKKGPNGLIALTIILVLTMLIAFFTYNGQYADDHHPILRFLVAHHLIVMVLLVGCAVAFGFLWSKNLYGEIERKQKNTKNMLDVIYLFLSRDEKTIVNYLVEKEGSSSQADISRLPNLNRVRAHRFLQKMEERNILTITAHGKMRQVKLNQIILETLQKK